MTLPPTDRGSDDDLLNSIGDVDPLKWLESLAARQGANPEEFVTSADLDVPEVAADAVIDEPGYQDYDPFGREKPARPAEPVRRPEPPPAAPAPQPAAEVDPLAWLESLARRQGANPEEFVTSADLEIEEVDAGAVIDEPGYTPFETFERKPRPAARPVDRDTLPPQEAAALLGLEVGDLMPPLVEEEFAIQPPAAVHAEDRLAEMIPPEPEFFEEPPPSGDDTLAWLEGLAAEQGAQAPLADPLAGLSDAEIDRRAAAGELTADQMEAWLQRQLDSLTQVREEGAAFQQPMPAFAAMEEEEEAFPEWLTEEAPAYEELPLDDVLAGAELEPLAPAELPDWLQDAEPVEALTDDQLATLFAAEMPDLAFDEPPLEEEDSWAVALDNEYLAERTATGDEEPEWYRAALEQQAEEPELAGPAPVASVVAEPPDWLAGAVPGAEVEEMPDWLTEAIPGAEAVTLDEREWLEDEAGLETEIVAEIPDWLQEPVAVAAEIPDWLREAAPDEMLAQAQPPAARPEALQMTVSAEIPAGAAYDSFRARLNAHPDDHGTRLALARRLVQENAVAASLGQYEALAFAEAKLPELEADLRGMVQERPTLPQARRVLGDVIMRQGRLREALEAYRAALEQL